MELPVSTYALLFPAVSLLFLAYTNRFLHLSELTRKLHDDWKGNHDYLLVIQISNLRERIILIRWMQFLGALCLLSCVLAMLLKIFNLGHLALHLFTAALCLMSASLLLLIREIWISGGAMGVILQDLESSVAEE